MNGTVIIDHLSCGYGRRDVIRDVTLPRLRPGSVTALIGPNAAGKSTMLRGLAGLLPVRGRLSIGGIDLTRLPAPRRAELVGFMPQNLIGHIGLSVLECVMVAMSRDSATALVADEAALAVLRRIGIADLANRPVGHLSGGQRQAVGLAVVISRNPHLLLLDEPTSALDLARRHMIMRQIRDLAREGHTIIVVLHDLAFAAQWADNIAVLAKGGLHAFGSPTEVITPDMLRDVYHVAARVEHCSAGRIQVMTDDAIFPNQ